jgi:hypothetical protein
MQLVKGRGFNSHSVHSFFAIPYSSGVYQLGGQCVEKVYIFLHFEHLSLSRKWLDCSDAIDLRSDTFARVKDTEVLVTLTYGGVTLLSKIMHTLIILVRAP